MDTIDGTIVFRAVVTHMKPLLGGIAQSRLLTSADVAAISVPVVVMWGKGERLLPESSLTFFQRHCPKDLNLSFRNAQDTYRMPIGLHWWSRRLRALAQLGSMARL